jgi:GT2 family glycosyltransferase
LAERIRPGVNGYLFDPNGAALVAALKGIDADRETLSAVRANVLGFQPPTAAHMVEQYRRITPVAAQPPARYPLGPGHGAADDAQPGQALAIASQAATVANMWKEVKSLHMQLAIVNEARLRTEVSRQHEAEEFRRVLEERKALKKRVAEQEALAGERDRHLQHLALQVNMQTAKLDEVLASTSWKASAPIRYAGYRLRKVRMLARCVASVLRQRGELRENGRRLHAAWRDGGFMEFKRTLLELEAREGRPDAWREYRETFRREVRPKIVERIATLSAKPLVSVIVPTYNTAEPMLRQMLQSVAAQLYPHWELCIADDGSREPHVRRILREFAAKDKRIKLHFGENMGVSHASNRALELATGEFAVLLDHDDVLEEQALFRVAESIVEDRPDMVYSDEVLVTPDANGVRRYAYRPAFSREYLRSHPYIVHLVGFRTELLRELGGFDESLRISQDYDLILRVVEKARTIVHIPEILYQWRLHGGSTGTQRMQEVMETSKAVLRRHLERCGERATVDDGTSFNLFDVRYPIAPGQKVAIIIPTKNCGDLLRQCIESIRATVKEADYDIVVIDHESDEPETLEYLASLGSSVQVLHYQGVFNFSAINNWAVARLDRAYSHYLFCNNDIEAIDEGWLERMLELAQQPSIGIVGAKLFYPDRESIQHAGVCVGLYGAAEHYGKRLRFPADPVEPGFGELLLVNHEVAAVTAACLLIRRDAFEEIGGFDEAILVGFGDVDLCLRVGEQGYRIVFCPHAKLVHHESYTRGTSTIDPHPEDSARYRSKWKALLHAGDPFHSPGLSLTSTQWALKNPLHCDFDIRRRIVQRDPGCEKRGRVHFSR